MAPGLAELVVSVGAVPPTVTLAALKVAVQALAVAALTVKPLVV